MFSFSRKCQHNYVHLMIYSKFAEEKWKILDPSEKNEELESQSVKNLRNIRILFFYSIVNFYDI